MKDFIIEGIAIGFDYKTWIEDRKILNSLLLSVLETWYSNVYDNQAHIKINVTEDEKREYGLIKNAKWSFEGDLTNLAINYHLLNSILKNDELEKGFKILYIKLLFENYITNLRSIYDACSFFPRIIMPIEEIKRYSKRKKSDSLNTFIIFCKSNEPISLPHELRTFMNDFHEDLEVVKEIRDSIIHQGKEPLIRFQNNEAYFRIPVSPPYGEKNRLPDILDMGNTDYPLKIYMKELTDRLFQFTENLGLILYNYLKEKGKEELVLTAIAGLCIEEFNNFLGYK